MKILFDVSSSKPGFTSLKDHLSAGDNLIADSLDTSLRFRSNKIAIIADIKKAFLQISLDESDRDFHEFLWYENVPKPDKELPKIVWGNFQAVFASSGNPKALESCKPCYGHICDKLKTSFYVDDLILSEHNLDAVKSACQQVYKIMRAANFILRKCNSNDKELRKTFPNDEVERKTMVKVLGIKWCTISDKISVDLEEALHHLLFV